MRRAAFLLLIIMLISLSSCSPGASATLVPGIPRIVYIKISASGGTQLFSQADTTSASTVFPYTFPGNCSVYRLFPNPVASRLAIEFACGDDSLVEVLDLDFHADALKPAYQETARFLSWSADGTSFYIRKNIFQEVEVAHLDGQTYNAFDVSIPGNTYDLAALPGGKILYSTTEGLGFGSETWLAGENGGNPERILSEPVRIVAYLRPSPDGSQAAFILMMDSQVPFSVGELWVMNVDGTNTRMLGQADAGHGYMPAWSADGTRIAFVVRENPGDQEADQSAAALLSNVYLVDVHGGEPFPITTFTDAIVETPAWSPDGSTLLFNVISDDTISVWMHDPGENRQFAGEAACCAVWVPGR